MITFEGRIFPNMLTLWWLVEWLFKYVWGVCCRYKFWLTNGDPWDFFHYHFSADEFYILPILMVKTIYPRDGRNISDIGDQFFSTGVRSFQLDPPDTYLQKCHPGRTLDKIKFKTVICPAALFAQQTTCLWIFSIML